MKFIVRPLARFDLLEAADFIEKAYNLDRVRAFFFAANETFTKLAQQPLLGSPRPHLAAQLPDLRQWRIKGFESYLIFYVPLPNGVEVVRVLHSRQNIQAILSDEEWQS